jgi:hypothetical protein
MPRIKVTLISALQGITISLLLLLQATQSNMPPAQPTSIELFRSYFNESFIRKMKGCDLLFESYDCIFLISNIFTAPFDVKTKTFLKGFNSAWDFYHLHHVCIRSGADGILYNVQGSNRTLPVEDKSKPETTVRSASNRIPTFSISHFFPILHQDFISELDWRKATKNSDTLQLIRMNDMTLEAFKFAMFYNTSALFANCFRQPSNSTNPAHLMMKLGFFYELANYYEQYGKDVKKIFKFPMPLPFDNAFMHQCADPFRTGFQKYIHIIIWVVLNIICNLTIIYFSPIFRMALGTDDV